MAQFFSIATPPQSLESLDNWGSVDGLPASLDSSLWNSAGIYGLSIAEQARALAQFVPSNISCLGGTLGASSSGSLQSSVLKVGAATGAAAGGATLDCLRLRFSGGAAKASTGGSLLGVGVLYMDMGGEARASGAMHGQLMASVQAGVQGACSGSLGLSFTCLLSLPGSGRMGGGMELAPKGWNWLARAPLAQSWEQDAPQPQVLWHEPERERSSAWH